MRIEELEDDIHDLQISLQEVSKEMAAARSDANNYKKTLDTKQKELESVKGSLTMDSQVKLFSLLQQLNPYHFHLHEIFSLSKVSQGKKLICFQQK